VVAPPGDAELALQALAGSEDACRTLVTRYATAAVNFAHRMVRDRAQAEDLAQDAFVRAFARLESYDPSRTFASWFFQILRNISIDYLRRKRLPTTPVEQLAGGGDAVVLVDPASSPESQAERSALAHTLDLALANLRPEYRDSIVLRYQEGLGVAEIAQVLDVPIGTVKTYLHRGRKELASTLSAKGWGPAATPTAETSGHEGS